MVYFRVFFSQVDSCAQIDRPILK